MRSKTWTLTQQHNLLSELHSAASVLSVAFSVESPGLRGELLVVALQHIERARDIIANQQLDATLAES